MQKLTPERINVLRAVRRKILASPRQFDMRIFIEERDCGTTCCIAGWIFVINNPNIKNFKPVGAGVIQYSSEKFLGMRVGEGCSLLFERGGWDEPYATQYEEAKTKTDKAKVAARYINYFIKKHS